EGLAVDRLDRELRVAQHALDGARGQVAVAPVRAEQRHLVLLPATEELVGREPVRGPLALEQPGGPALDARLPVGERAGAVESDGADRHGCLARSLRRG